MKCIHFSTKTVSFLGESYSIFQKCICFFVFLEIHFWQRSNYFIEKCSNFWEKLLRNVCIQSGIDYFRAACIHVTSLSCVLRMYFLLGKWIHLREKCIRSRQKSSIACWPKLAKTAIIRRIHFAAVFPQLKCIDVFDVFCLFPGAFVFSLVIELQYVVFVLHYT